MVSLPRPTKHALLVFAAFLFAMATMIAGRPINSNQEAITSLVATTLAPVEIPSTRPTPADGLSPVTTSIARTRLSYTTTAVDSPTMNLSTVTDFPSSSLAHLTIDRKIDSNVAMAMLEEDWCERAAREAVEIFSHKCIILLGKSLGQ